jgi:hypothetical protein
MTENSKSSVSGYISVMCPIKMNGSKIFSSCGDILYSLINISLSKNICSPDLIKIVNKKHISCFQISLLDTQSVITPFRNSMYRELYYLSCFLIRSSFMLSKVVISFEIPSLNSCKPTFQSLILYIVYSMYEEKESIESEYKQS